MDDLRNRNDDDYKRMLKPGDVFYELVKYQFTSPNLVVWSILAGCVVEIAWPTHNGVPIQPSGIRAWLRLRGLHWACFCSMLLPEGETRTTRITESGTKAVPRTTVTCGGDVTQDCGFHIILNDRLQTTTLFASYHELPTRVSGVEPHLKSILREFQEKVDRVDTVTLGEYFRGYAGEHMSHFPYVEQRSGNPNRISFISMAQATPSIAQGPYYRPPIPHIRTTPTTPYVPTFDPLAARYAALLAARKASAASPAATRVRRRLPPATASSPNQMTSLPSTSTSAATAPASTSTSTSTTTTTAKFSALPPYEKELVQDFVSGRGISLWEWEAMWEKCGLCGDVFLTSAFAVHTEECRGIELD